MATTVNQNDLDSTLIRSNHFDKKIVLRKPSFEERKKIIQFFQKTMPISPEINIDILLQRIGNCTYAALFKIINEAALCAAQQNKVHIEQEDFDEILEQIQYGEKVTKSIESDRKRTAYHEAGHALMSFLINNSLKKFYKVTIIPRIQAQGITYYVSKYESYAAKTKDEIITDIMIKFGGYTAEEIIFGNNSTGIHGDLTKITNLIADMVLVYGMSSVGKLVTNINNYSQDTRAIIDQEIKKLSEEYYENTKQLLLENKEKLILLAEELLKKEVMYAEEVYALLKIK